MTTASSEIFQNQALVTFGGGTGHFHLLDGLKRFNHPRSITAIVGTWDSGGSSGRLRSQLGVLPPGDIRRCILALMEDNEQQRVAQRVFDERIDHDAPTFSGHSLGNLIGARLDQIFHGQDRGTDAQRALFRIRANILPVSLNDLQLIAITKAGVRIEGETHVDRRSRHPQFDPSDQITRIFFDSSAAVNPAAADSVRRAEKIIFAPGDLFTSILPHLLVDGIKEAIVSSPAKLCFIINLTTKPGETDGFAASDHLNKFVFYLGDPNRVDYVLVNDSDLPLEVVDIYRAQGQNLVMFDEANCRSIVPKAEFVVAPFGEYLRREHLLRHDPLLLARKILGVRF